MKVEQHNFLQLLRQPPARLTVQQLAWTLGCQMHDIPILVRARLIKPLGNPASNAIKFFSAEVILEQAKDPAWLAKITNTINQAWQKKNKRQQQQFTEQLTRETDAFDLETTDNHH